MKTLRKILVAGMGSLAIGFGSCTLPNENIIFDIPKITYETNDLNGVLKYTANNIHYKSDIEQYGIEDYWETPDKTFNSKFGDCESYVILNMYLLKRDFNIESRMIRGFNENGKHAWLEIDGVFYDCQAGYEWDFWNYKILDRLNYEWVMSRVLYEK